MEMLKCAHLYSQISKSHYLVAQTVKNLPATQETWVWSLGLEDPLKKGVATHYSILAWRMPWTEEPGGLQSMGSQRVGHDWATNTTTTTVWSLALSSLSGLCTTLQTITFLKNLLISILYLKASIETPQNGPHSCTPLCSELSLSSLSSCHS